MNSFVRSIKIIWNPVVFASFILFSQNLGQRFQSKNGSYSEGSNLRLSLEKLQKFDRGTEVFDKNFLGCLVSDMGTSSKFFISLNRLNSALSGGVEDIEHLKISDLNKNNVVYALESTRADFVEGLTRLGHMVKRHISVCNGEQIDSSLMRRLSRRKYINTLSMLSHKPGGYAK